MRVTTGAVPFGEYRTHWRAVGNLNSGRPALLLLHGGPGSTRTYFELLDRLANTGRAVVSYDQLGCGESYMEGHPELWCARTWVDELVNLRKSLGLGKVHLLGQSWGGMLAIQYLADRAPQGVCSAILSSTLPSSQLWAREQHRMARQLPAEEQAALEAAERSGAYGGEAYQRAIDHYMQLHCADVVPPADAPECLRRPRKTGKESYECAWGPNELVASGTLASWDYVDKLGEIQTPCLVVSGTDDLCTPLVAKTMYDRLPHARWELMEGCRHMCFADANDRYCETVAAWMEEHE